LFYLSCGRHLVWI